MIEARHLSKMSCCWPAMPAVVVSTVLDDGQHIVECECGAVWNGTVESWHLRAEERLDAVLDQAVAFGRAFG